MTISEMMEGAARRDLAAMWELAMAYFRGEGVEEDDSKAFSLFRELETIAPGNAALFYRLGQCYYNGWGTARNMEQGLGYFRMASDGGSPDASFVMGKVYREGKAVPSNPDAVLFYFNRAVEQGNDEAMVALGDMFHSGKGVDHNEKEAARLYKMSADLTNAEACYRMGVQTLLGNGVTEDHLQAVEYWKKGAELGDLESQFLYGLNCVNEETIPQDIETGLYWLEKAADRGWEKANQILGDLYLKGDHNVPVNEEKGVFYLSKVAEKGNIEAIGKLGNYYFNAKKLTEALNWFEKGTDLNDPYSTHLAVLCQHMLAIAGSMSSARRGMEMGYEFSKDDWKKAADLAVKEMQLLQSGSELSTGTEYEDARKVYDEACYEVASCCYEMKQYAEAVEYSAKSTLWDARLLNAVSGLRLCGDNEQKISSALNRLMEVYRNTPEKTEWGYEEEHHYAMAAYSLALGFRVGMPGFSRRDPQAADRILRTALGRLRIEDFRNFVARELS